MSKAVTEVGTVGSQKRLGEFTGRVPVVDHGKLCLRRFPGNCANAADPQPRGRKALRKGKSILSWQSRVNRISTCTGPLSGVHQECGWKQGGIDIDSASLDNRKEAGKLGNGEGEQKEDVGKAGRGQSTMGLKRDGAQRRA